MKSLCLQSDFILVEQPDPNTNSLMVGAYGFAVAVKL
jgi:hypothetical protein